MAQLDTLKALMGREGGNLYSMAASQIFCPLIGFDKVKPRINVIHRRAWATHFP